MWTGLIATLPFSLRRGGGSRSTECLLDRIIKSRIDTAPVSPSYSAPFICRDVDMRAQWPTHHIVVLRVNKNHAHLPPRRRTTLYHGCARSSASGRSHMRVLPPGTLCPTTSAPWLILSSSENCLKYTILVKFLKHLLIFSIWLTVVMHLWSMYT